MSELPEARDAGARRWMLFYLFGHLRDFVRQRLERSKKVQTLRRLPLHFMSWPCRVLSQLYRLRICFKRDVDYREFTPGAVQLMSDCIYVVFSAGS